MALTKLFNSTQSLIFLIWGDWARFPRYLNFKRFRDFYSASKIQSADFLSEEEIKCSSSSKFPLHTYWYSFILFFIGLLHLIKAILRWLIFPWFLIQLIFSSTLYDFSSLTLVRFFCFCFSWFPSLGNSFNIKFTMLRCIIQWLLVHSQWCAGITCV